jgi:NAD(P)-dependent dehydrogenase (short-subunit alcohol dehydrogenase family)
MTREAGPGRPADRRWTSADVPAQDGRVAVITGANSGIGLEVATLLARRAATVVLACRDLGRAAAAADQIRRSVPGATIETVRVDLADLASVRDGAAKIRSQHPRIDLLIANAGVSMPPRQLSADGFELQFATNHLGHFALVGLLLDRLTSTPGSRVVMVSSVLQAIGRVRFDDLDRTRRYSRAGAYAQSKLAVTMFAVELQRRLEAVQSPTIALTAHPGSSATDIARHIPRVERALAPLASVLQQGADVGALSVLRAAVDPDARGGEQYGPRGPLQWRGHPTRVRPPRRSGDPVAGRRLWEESERRTGVEIRLTTLTR